MGFFSKLLFSYLKPLFEGIKGSRGFIWRKLCYHSNRFPAGLSGNPNFKFSPTNFNVSTIPQGISSFRGFIFWKVCCYSDRDLWGEGNLSSQSARSSFSPDTATLNLAHRKFVQFSWSSSHSVSRSWALSDLLYGSAWRLPLGLDTSQLTDSSQFKWLFRCSLCLPQVSWCPPLT